MSVSDRSPPGPRREKRLGAQHEGAGPRQRATPKARTQTHSSHTLEEYLFVAGTFKTRTLPSSP